MHNNDSLVILTSSRLKYQRVSIWLNSIVSVDLFPETRQFDDNQVNRIATGTRGSVGASGNKPKFCQSLLTSLKHSRVIWSATKPIWKRSFRITPALSYLVFLVLLF